MYKEIKALFKYSKCCRLKKHIGRKVGLVICSVSGSGSGPVCLQVRGPGSVISEHRDWDRGPGTKSVSGPRTSTSKKQNLLDFRVNRLHICRCCEAVRVVHEHADTLTLSLINVQSI